MTKIESAHCLRNPPYSVVTLSKVGLRHWDHCTPNNARTSSAKYVVGLCLIVGLPKFEALFYSAEDKKGKTRYELVSCGVGSWVWCPSNSIR